MNTEIAEYYSVQQRSKTGKIKYPFSQEHKQKPLSVPFMSTQTHYIIRFGIADESSLNRMRRSSIPHTIAYTFPIITRLRL